jgi:ATP-dependent phosphoenolpyruvate carboxykinase
MYHFLSGYTARVAGTEIGVTEPEATFSTCFGAPFMPRHPSVYGNLLKERIAKGGVKCWLVNTGWSGGKATMEGIKRMPIKATRALLNAALDGSLNEAEFREDPNFGFEVPVAVPGVDTALLDPRGLGPIRSSTTRPRRNWSGSSSTTSSSLPSMSTKACATRPRFRLSRRDDIRQKSPGRAI